MTLTPYHQLPLKYVVEMTQMKPTLRYFGFECEDREVLVHLFGEVLKADLQDLENIAMYDLSR